MGRYSMIMWIIGHIVYCMENTVHVGTLFCALNAILLGTCASHAKCDIILYSSVWDNQSVTLGDNISSHCVGCQLHVGANLKAAMLHE